MFPAFHTAVIDESGVASAIEKTVNIADKIKKHQDGKILHAAGIMLSLDGQGDVATAAINAWTDIWDNHINKLILRCTAPGATPGGKEYDAFNLKAKGIRLHQALRDNVLITEKSVGTGNDQPLNACLIFPFAGKNDQFFPNLIPVDRLRECTIEVDASSGAHANLTWDSLRVRVYVLLVRLSQEVASYVPVSWIERTGFADYHVEAPSDGIIQAAYLCNAKGSDASKITEINSDELHLNAMNGIVTIEAWAKLHPFLDVLDDQSEDYSEDMWDYANVLMEAQYNSKDSGVRGPIKWYGESGTFPQTNTALFRMIPDL